MSLFFTSYKRNDRIGAHTWTEMQLVEDIAGELALPFNKPMKRNICGVPQNKNDLLKKSIFNDVGSCLLSVYGRLLALQRLDPRPLVDFHSGHHHQRDSLCACLCSVVLRIEDDLCGCSCN